jgi:tetratricopeptide (TPR) repeat protein
MLVVVALMVGGVIGFISKITSRAPAAPVEAKATSDMPVPEIEMVTPTEEGKLATDNAEKEMLKKLENVPQDSPQRFEPYGIFAQQAEGAGFYEKAEEYYEKALAIGPSAYKTYFAKPAGDFQLNYVSMFTNTGRLQEAANAANKVYDQELEVMGRENERTIEAGIALASALGDVKKYHEKQVLSQVLVTRLETTGKTGSGDYVTALRCVGESCQGQNDMSHAKSWYLKALAAAKAKPELQSYIDNLNQTLASFASIEAAPESN